MITPRITGAIVTSIIIILGIALLYPALKLDTKFIGKHKMVNDVNDNQVVNDVNDNQVVNDVNDNQVVNDVNDDQVVLLTLNIVNSSNLPTWCYELSKFLQDNKLNSTVFMTGAVADRYPSCIPSFGSDVDIGSSSFTYNNITSTPGYTHQLDLIKQGKKSIDTHGMMNSTSFRAPYGNVDENIFSQLARSQIFADFSYRDHYNVYTNGPSGRTFYRSPLITLNNTLELQKLVPNPEIPLMMNFYNYQSAKSIEDFLKSTSRNHLHFKSASELTKMNLTIR
jgi:hypothetical protein